ncbi:MAG: XRE family transcriptional regulator [Polyangiaceae bacterium]|nr:XRE family transcriptional regulator [Polyangiaceae bacterium]
MSPEDIKQLRKDLGCTARELAETLGLEQKEVLAWEDGELFPTKRWVSAMQRLRQEGPSAIKKKPRGKAKGATGMARLHDAELWAIVRKLLAHPQLFERVKALAADFDDPS